MLCHVAYNFMRILSKVIIIEYRAERDVFSHSVESDSLWPHGLQHTWLSCPSPTTWASSNSCPLDQWCHPIISSSIIPFSSCSQSSPASRPFPVSQLFASGSQSIGASASASVLPMNIQGWFSLGGIDWISLLSKGFSRVFSNTSSKASILWRSAFFMVQRSHPYMTTGKIIALTIRTCVSKVNNLRDDFKYTGGWGYIICKHTILCKGFEKLQILVSTREEMSWNQSSANMQGRLYSWPLKNLGAGAPTLWASLIA